MTKPLTAGEKIARDLCEMDAPIDNIIEVDPVDVARRIDEEVFSILDSLADCEFRNERLVADYASIQEELSTIRRIHVQNIAIKDAEIARWKTVPMKYRRMEFNAQLQFEIAEQRVDHMKLVEENHELRQQLAASQIEAKRLRDTMQKIAGHPEETPPFYWWQIYARNALSSPASTEVLDAYVAEKVKENSKSIDEFYVKAVGFGEIVEKLTQQRDLAVSALEYHQSQTRPIENTMNALAAIKESESPNKP